ncbi:hypothetical protein BsWGS_28684 [Bradybaena similaris]
MKWAAVLCVLALSLLLTIASSANYDADVYFLLDASDSIGPENYEMRKLKITLSFFLEPLVSVGGSASDGSSD